MRINQIKEIMETRNRLNLFLLMGFILRETDNNITYEEAKELLKDSPHTASQAREMFREDVRRNARPHLLDEYDITITESNFISWTDKRISDPRELIAPLLKTLREWDIDVYGFNYFAQEDPNNDGGFSDKSRHYIHLQSFDL